MNKTDPPHVAICACTIDRPEGLLALLAGIRAQRFAHGARPRLSLVIVDNSATGSARDLLQQQQAILGMPLVHAHEPGRGYAIARNALLDAAPVDADWLAFIDDDEVPPPHWLEALLRTAETSAADLVCGPVRPLFAENAPLWAREGGFFELGPFVDGAAATYVSTNNALVRAKAIRDPGWRFDMAFNRDGGEDEHFFARAMRAGLKAVTSADAWVEETIAATRTSRSWLFARHRRMGRTIARIDRERGRTAARALKAVAWLGPGLFRFVAGGCGERVMAIEGLCRIARSLGSLEELLRPRHS